MIAKKKCLVLLWNGQKIRWLLHKIWRYDHLYIILNINNVIQDQNWKVGLLWRNQFNCKATIWQARPMVTVKPWNTGLTLLFLLLYEFIQITLPWFFSFNKFFVAGKNISISSGTFLMTWTAHSAAYKEEK